MSNFYVGLMSGTSLDGIDAAIVDFSTQRPQLISTHYEPYEKLFRQQLLTLCVSGDNEIERLGYLDRELGERFASATLKLLAKSGLAKSAICAIGSHGQTIRHHSKQARQPFTLQIGDPNTLASLTGLTTVADFRR